MEKLVDLPDVTRLSATIVRILGQNPGKFTLQGTNTYLVGRRPPFILVDLGEGKEGYTELLRSHLLSVRPEATMGGRMVSDVIITHEHADHFGGMLSVLSLLNELSSCPAATDSNKGPRIHKFPSPPAAAPLSSRTGTESRAYDHSLQYNSVLDSIPAHLGLFTPALTDNEVHDLIDGQVLETEDGSTKLRVVHTPGHTADSICLLLSSPSAECPNDDGCPIPILLTADSVLGQGTAVFEDLSTYLRSLSRLVSPEFSTDYGSYEVVYPGHGPIVEDGPGTIRTYIKHRLEREAQITQVLGGLQLQSSDTGSESESEGVKIWDIVKTIYKDYPENLWAPAARGVVLHLKKLEVDGKASCVGGQGVEQRWLLTSS